MGYQWDKNDNGDLAVHEITVDGGETKPLTVYDRRQKYELTFTVYDETTRYDKKVAVPGITFNIYSPDNALVESRITDENGRITTSLDTLFVGDYYMEQVGSVANYAMNLESEDPELNCNRIVLESTATDSGVNLQETLIHYEGRQTFTIKAHVQDYNLGSSTKAELGGEKDSGSLVTLVGAEYQLFNKTKITLGYDKRTGEEIFLPPSNINPLRIVTTYSDNETTLISNEKDFGISYDGRLETNGTDKAFLYVDKIVYGGVQYPIPNGVYEWKLKSASSGYYNDTENTGTKVDASWKTKNQEIQEIDIKNLEVKQKRQSAEIVTYVKGYNPDGRQSTVFSGFDNLLKTTYGKLINKFSDASKDTSSAATWTKFADKNATKTIYSDSLAISTDSNEMVEVNITSPRETFYVKTKDKVPNAIYELYALCDIVDINTGKTIKRGTLIGRYMSNEEGVIEIKKMGSAEFDNPNKNVGDDKIIKAVDPKTSAKKSVSGHKLPNGTYGLTPYVLPDNHYSEKWLDEAFTTGLTIDDKNIMWDSGTNSLKTKNVDCLVALAIEDKNTIDTPQIPVAPDVPVKEEGGIPDPYDPQFPDDPNDPDDSEDITLKDIDWILEHNDEITYRIIDSGVHNTIQDEDGDVVKYEVEDKLPTTFAYVAKNDLKYDDEIYEYKYSMMFYYEITEEEYSNSTASQRDSGEFIYIERFEKYARRFSSSTYPGTTGSVRLDDVFTFNDKSDGLAGVSQNEALENKTISAAISNYTWLNNELAKQADEKQTEGDGEFLIFLIANVEIKQKSKSDDSYKTIEYTTDEYRIGVISIKNRHLFKLD